MDLRERIAADMPNTIAALERLVRIPSRGYPGYDPTDVRASAEATRDVLIEVGVDGARLLELPGGHPAVYGEVPGPSGAPTILLYAHHDVQPEGPLDQWDTPPFEPAVRDGRLYGRGAADDKSGIVTHAAAISALLAEGPMPCTVKVLVEGEEECTTEHLPDLVRGNADLLRADVAVIADGGNQRTGLPAIDISLRGVTDCVVQVRVLDQAQHSGTYGGAIPDAITALARILASLHDDDGNVAIEGLRRFTWPGHQLDEAELLREVGARPGVRTIAAGTVSDRVWGGPAVSVLGIDAPAIHGSSNQLVPVASARVSLRLAPGDDAAEGRRRLIDHLKAHAPWGVEVTISDDAGGFEAGQGHLIATDSPAFRAARAALAQAYGVEPLEVGSGGSIPLVPMLVEALPGIEVLIVGAMDERSNIHSVNESVDLGDLERSALAEALFIRTLGAEG